MAFEWSVELPPIESIVRHVLVLPVLDLRLPRELRIRRTAARNSTCVPFFTLVHSVFLEISDLNTISNDRFPVVSRDVFYSDTTAIL